MVTGHAAGTAASAFIASTTMAARQHSSSSCAALAIGLLGTDRENKCMRWPLIAWPPAVLYVLYPVLPLCHSNVDIGAAQR